MLPKDLTRDIKARLNTLKGQIEGVVKSIEEEHEPDRLLNQFKAIDKGFQSAYYLLLDEVYRKELAIKIVEVFNACPGNCPDAEKIEFFRQQFPRFEIEELTDKIKEINRINSRLKGFIEEIDSQKVVIPIEGMTCDGCIARIKKAVKAIDGVSEVEVSLEQREAIVIFDNQLVSAENIADTINKLDYKTGTPRKYKKQE